MITEISTSNFRKTRALIDLNAIKSNLLFLKSQLQSKDQFFCPMVKSNGYGHGDIEVARICEQVGVSGVGVALLEEGIRLRKSGISCDIFVFGPILDEAVGELVTHRLVPVIGQWPELRALKKVIGDSGSVDVHIKFNTGMNRLGFPIQESDRLVNFFESEKNINLAGICSHLSDGDDVGVVGGVSERQIEALVDLEKKFLKFSPIVHLWNSSGWFSMLKHKSELEAVSQWGVRPGIAIYGVQPLETEIFTELKPAMILESEIVTIQKVLKGQSVSYGSTWTADKDTLVGVIPIGYADGYSRAFSRKGQMIVGGQKVPVLGVICMDYTMVNLTDLNIDPKQDLGKEVILLGRQGDQKITAEELAEVIDTIPYEIITCIGRRVPREFKGHL